MKDSQKKWVNSLKLEDPIVESVVSELRRRSVRGIEKYGTTLKDNNKDDFLQHLKEELMDGICYIQKLQDENKTD